MAVTDNLRKQHKQLLDIVNQMSACLRTDKILKDASQVRSLLSKLTRNLTYHLLMEDDALYPALFRHPDKKVRSLAKKYFKEMGGISAEFKRYVAKWSQVITVQKNPDDFISETRGVFDGLLRRIDKEDNELYTLVENNVVRKLLRKTR